MKPSSRAPKLRPGGGARAQVRQDLVDHRGLRDARHDPHRAVAGGTRERVDFEDLLQEGHPSAGGFSGRESWRGDDHGRRLRRHGFRRRVLFAMSVVVALIGVSVAVLFIMR